MAGLSEFTLMRISNLNLSETDKISETLSKAENIIIPSPPTTRIDDVSNKPMKIAREPKWCSHHRVSTHNSYECHAIKKLKEKKEKTSTKLEFQNNRVLKSD